MEKDLPESIHGEDLELKHPGPKFNDRVLRRRVRGDTDRGESHTGYWKADLRIIQAHVKGPEPPEAGRGKAGLFDEPSGLCAHRT